MDGQVKKDHQGLVKHPKASEGSANIILKPVGAREGSAIGL